MAESAGGQFLDALRAFESGIDPALARWYQEHLDVPMIEYAQVARPGRLKRDWESGAPMYRRISVREYFCTLGVLEDYDCSDPSSLTRMQYRSMNPWGFVGYQLGEAALMEAGFYRAAVAPVDELPKYYAMILPDATWRAGCTETLLQLPDGDRSVWATDVNTWRGVFTGKAGIHSLEDLMQPARQERVIRALMRRNIETIALNIHGTAQPPQEFWQQQREVQLADGKRSVPISLSGVLAAAHLCGAQATARFLKSGAMAADEQGTTIVDYLERFAGMSVDLSSGSEEATSDR